MLLSFLRLGIWISHPPGLNQKLLSSAVTPHIRQVIFITHCMFMHYVNMDCKLIVTHVSCRRHVTNTSDQFLEESIIDSSSNSGLGNLTAAYRMKVLLFDEGPIMHTLVCFYFFLHRHLFFFFLL